MRENNRRCFSKLIFEYGTNYSNSVCYFVGLLCGGAPCEKYSCNKSLSRAMEFPHGIVYLWFNYDQL